MRRGGVDRCQPNGRCRRSSASEKRCPGERTTATVSVPPPGMWACLPLCGGRGNGHWRTAGENAFPGHGRLRPAQAERPRVRHEHTRRRRERAIVQPAALVFATAASGGRRVSRRGTRSGRSHGGVRGCRCAAGGFLPPRVAQRTGRVLVPRWRSGPGCPPWPGRGGSVTAAGAGPHTSQPRGCQWAARRRAA